MTCKLATYRYVGPKKSKGPLMITDDIALWLMRMCVGEGGMYCSYEKAQLLCRTIINRWFLWPGARFYRTFVGLMRAFSQPINPRWMTGGDLARKYVGRSAASKGRLRRRARIVKMTLEQIPTEIKYAVEQIQAGRYSVKMNQRASNWASLKSTPKKYPHGFDKGGDWFFEDSNHKPGHVECE